MKKLMFAALVCFIGSFTSCKDKNATETEDTTEITSEPADTTTTDTTTVAPAQIDNPEPGVEKSGSSEQVP